MIFLEEILQATGKLDRQPRKGHVPNAQVEIIRTQQAHCNKPFNERVGGEGLSGYWNG